jgi:hypothetical protein
MILSSPVLYVFTGNRLDRPSIKPRPERGATADAPRWVAGWVRAAWMARAIKAVALAPRRRQVSMTLASSAMLLEPTSVRVP